MKGIIKWFTDKIEQYRKKRLHKKKLKELRKKDPFIYNH